MRPSQVVIHVGTPPEQSPRTSSDFEEISYPVHQSPSWARSAREEELPLHYMNEETARRRVFRGSSGNGPLPEPSQAVSEKEYEIYDDEGKDVYAKMKDMRSPLGSGRLRRPPPPPPTTVVRVLSPLVHSLAQLSSRASSSNKTSNISLRLYIPSFLAGRASTG